MIDKVQLNGLANRGHELTRAESGPGVTPDKPRPPDKEVPDGGVSDEVSLSDDALALQRALQAVRNAPDVRTDVVERIRGEIEAGTYQVNVEALAARLIAFLR